MLPLNFATNRRGNYRILCLGAHSDDIEIGCGGSILQLLQRHRNLDFHWVVFSSGHKREREARRSAGLFLRGAAKENVVVHDFRNGYFPSVLSDIKDYFEELKAEISPDIIFTHTRHDLHQDHRALNQLTWNTWRNHVILEYEIPKYDGDLGTPNFYIPFDRKIGARKIKYLMDCFGTQRDKHWFTPDTFHGLMRIRGIEANSEGGLAEGFYARKVVLGG
ncbi:MAG: PIG-L family deacetylase [Acidobacteriia bacterium]|nr:PIG-L family deacetylase [Terriglobia bacterium]